MRSVLSADLGGTKCRIALVTEDFAVHQVQRVATVHDRAQFLQLFEAAAARVLEQRPAGVEPPAALGIGLAGVVRPLGREVVRTPNLPLDAFAMADYLEPRLGLTTTLLNDGRASAYGEFLRGSARGSDPLLCLFFGTGIGIGLIVGGRPYEGADNAAGEIGHLVYHDGGEVCACGGRGHFEAYCGGRAIDERATRELGPAPGGRGWRVEMLLARDDAVATAILAEASRAAAVLTANACTLLNPRAIVLGGGVIEAWPQLRQTLETETRRRCAPAVTANLQFVRSLGGSDAILWGAAAATGALWRS